jgi:hypothetical protein
MDNQEQEQINQDGEDILRDLEQVDFKRKSIVKSWLWIFGIFFVILMFFVFLYLRYWLPMKTITNEASRAESYFMQAQDELLDADFISATKSLKEAEISLRNVEQGVGKLGYVAQIGPLKDQKRALEVLAVSGQYFSSGLQRVSDISSKFFEPIQKNQNLSFSQISSEEKKDLLKMVYEVGPEIHGARAQIELAQAQLEALDRGRIYPIIRKAYDELYEKTKEVGIALERAETMSRIFPAVLGYPKEKNYLYLLQNYNELRATGGFIGTVGILKVADAEIKSFETANVYELDINAEGKINTKAPAPITEYAGVKGWYLRDSNWSPDFLISAGNAEKLFNMEAAFPGSPFPVQNFDGVVAITPKVIEDFLGLVGAIEAGSFVFNQENFTERLQYLVEIGYEEVGNNYSNRKDIISDLSKKLFNRFLNMKLSEMVELTKIIEKELKEKHILLSLNDNFLQQKIEAENWGGRILPNEYDYLLFVDSNLAALKTDEYIDRQIDYSVTQSGEGDYIAKASIHYNNRADFTWKSTRYRTYTRLYVPKGSELIKTEGSMIKDKSSIERNTDVFVELDKTVFGNFISIEPGDTGTLTFFYKLPKELAEKIEEDKKYELLVQKQAGTIKYPLALKVSFPEKINIAKPAEDREKWGDKTYSMKTDLSIDRKFEISF